MSNQVVILPIGTKVFDILLQEWGEVISYEEEATYPYRIKFNSRFDSYNKDGIYCTSLKAPQLSLTKFNHATGKGKFTPITEYKEK